MSTHRDSGIGEVIAFLIVSTLLLLIVFVGGYYSSTQDKQRLCEEQGAFQVGGGFVLCDFIPGPEMKKALQP